jgi:hypothetical protein
LRRTPAAALLLARGTSFTTAAVADDVPPPHPRALPHAPPPNNMLIVASLSKPDAAALLPRQHRVRRPTPATALAPRQYRWRRRPRRDGSVGQVALASSSSAARLGSECFIIFSLFFCEFFVCFCFFIRTQMGAAMSPF